MEYLELGEPTETVTALCRVAKWMEANFDGFLKIHGCLAWLCACLFCLFGLGFDGSIEVY